MSGPPDLSPREAAERWLDKRSVELSEGTVSGYWYRLKKLVEFAEERDIERMQDLQPWDIDEFDAEFRSRSPQKITLAGEYRTINHWLDWAESLGLVADGVSSVLDPPSTSRDEEVNRERLLPEVAQANLATFRSQPVGLDRATLPHTLLELMWWSGARIGALRGLDRSDVDLAAGTVEFVDRAETGTPIKPAFNPERVIGFPDDVVSVLEDYVREVRPSDTFDEHGREPLLATVQGRLAESTARRYSYFVTVPCHGAACPHERQPDTCEWFNKKQARGCPSARSPHAVRTGAITNLRNSGWSLDEVAERVNTSPERIKRHYDFPDKDEQYRERRASLVDRLGLTDTEDSDNDS